MKKLCVALAVAMCAAVALAGCGNGDGGPSFDPSAITIMGKESDLKKNYMQRIFDLYRASGENINVMYVEDGLYEQKSLELERAGKLPDLYLHFHNADLDNLDVENNFEYLNGAEWETELTASAAKYCTDGDGNLLGLPFWESSVSGCYYNKTIFAKYGLGPVTDQADFDGLCRLLAGEGVTPVCWAADGCSWMQQFALDPVFADDAKLLEDLNASRITYAEIPGVRAMTEWIYNAAKSGWFGKNYLSTGWDGISRALSSGEAAMTFIWDTWFYTDFTPGAYGVDDFALMPVFMNTAEGGTYEGGNLNMMMVNKKGDKKEKALDFLSFCADPENYNAAFKDISTVSVFRRQTTNIQSKMVTDAAESIAAHERVSTASTKIAGYSSDKVCAVFKELLSGAITVDRCIERLDRDRLAAAHGLI